MPAPLLQAGVGLVLRRVELRESAGLGLAEGLFEFGLERVEPAGAVPFHQ